MVPLLNQTQTWLKLPKVWRFVGFASASLGLLCFALSSSFNSLFGEWSFLKTFLYIIFSSIICVAVLFAKKWQHSRSLRFKAHMAFLVLTITSFYSSFFDKHAKGKPDAYSLVSCAAFAVMSLSLSRQTHCGIEVDLLYFFVGALIIQLTKIKWLLGTVGAGFGYFLIILRSYLDALPEEANRYIGLQDQPQVIIHVGPPQEDNTQDHAITQVDSHSQEASANTALMPQLLASIKALSENNLLLIRLLKQTLRKPFQPDHNLFIDALPSKTMSNLNEIMKLAVAAGFEKECCQLYSDCRKEFLRQCISALKLQDFINEEDNVVLTTGSIRSWIRASKIAIRILFPNERRLCDPIFSGLSSSKELSFSQICREPAIRLVNFAKALSAETDLPEILMQVVQVFMTLREIIPELESLFSDQDDLSLVNEAILTHNRLGEAIRDVYKHIENLIHCDTEITDVPGGIYPITCYTVKCLGLVMEARHIIKKGSEEFPMVGDTGETSPLFLVAIAKIIELLESHLEAKSKIYTEPGLGYFSMMNNTLHIRNNIGELSRRASVADEDDEELLKLIPIFCNDQMQKLNEEVQRNLEDYRRSSWNEVLCLLNLDNKEESVTSDVAAESMKEKLKLFNIQFQKMCNIQSKWFAHDYMRGRIIVAIENMLLPAYGNFIGRFQDVVGKHAYEYIKYGMFDMKAQLNHIFLGGKRMNL